MALQRWMPATKTDETEIIWRTGTTNRFRDNVVNVHAQATVVLRSLAVGTAAFIAFGNQFTQGGRNRHGISITMVQIQCAPAMLTAETLLLCGA